MCDYSLHNMKTRPAQVGDKVTTRLFKSGTRGFCAPEDKSVAICLLPGTELPFTEDVRRVRSWPWTTNAINYKTAIFRQINKDNPAIHHDALEFPDGRIVLLTYLERVKRPRFSSCWRQLLTPKAPKEAARALNRRS